MPEDTERHRVRRVRWKNARPELDREAERYYVYRLFDASGALLYIGRSCDPLTRLRGHHATGAEWPTRAVQIEGHGPYTWDEAVRIEREEILSKQPLHNIDGVVKNTGRRISLQAS